MHYSVLSARYSSVCNVLRLYMEHLAHPYLYSTDSIITIVFGENIAIILLKYIFACLCVLLIYVNIQQLC